MKGKKLLAGALSAAMVLSTASFTAFAAEITGNAESGIQVLNTTAALDGVKIQSFGSENNMNEGELHAEVMLLTLSDVKQDVNSVSVKLYHDNELLSTTTARDSYTGAYRDAISMTIITNGDAAISGSWKTVINQTDWYGKKPNKIVVNINGEEKTFENVEIRDGVDKYEKMEVAKRKVAKIGEATYSLEKALATAQTGETITLIDDAEINNVPNAKITNAATINLNGKTLTLNDGGIQLAGINFVGGEGEARGKIVATNNTGYQGVLYLCWGGTTTFTNIDIDATALNNAYVIEAQTWSENNIVLDNTTIDATGDTTRGLSTVIAAWGGNFTMKNSSKIEVSNTTGHAINGGANVTITDSTVTATNTEDGIYHSGGSLKIDGNSNVTVVNPTGDETWNPTAAGIVLGAETPYTKADTATVNTSIYRAPSASNIANDEIKLSFEDVTVNAGEKVYDLYVEAASNKTINRLTTADLTFALTNDSANTTPISYEVFGTDKVTVQPDNADSNKYLFYFNGLTAPSGTGVKVKVGQVKFNGYGKFGFKATAGEAHATTIDGENVVTDFVAGNQLDGQGKLNISTELTDVEIKVPTKELTINIDFPNAVNDNVKAYQDMKVTVVGGTVNEEYKLGNDSEAMVDGKYVITTNLPENTPYTVEVSGAGYRTARYTVTMNADKTLNFWNNVKDNATVVETGNEAIKKNVTFLAGELVNDGKINIYDLSAIVSYFGTTNNTETASDYAKYDLNRDGKIDSKDIAYVLVSWGK